ncbi:Hsp20/alpha crystallin family protein [Aspergillus saccharolyticus JOP 1030-1]|uniref:Putative heat shock Hsp30-like protein n=1 Tax=Aspergillus saccharolyticus JOP 1030-1 TaxID=1450539 RepID=A0A318Z728_9EURO|nr:putative heat shock Hsp30-like protein [Aspergillus saccharolyticus JOP 1030-1]PYH40533.1 putative heat shock Hsp30-like protein [Aspergillus saccharolyticus JOP 1030-1]
MAHFPRLSNDIFPLFQFLDDYDCHRSNRAKPALTKRALSLKSDVFETSDAFHLSAEVPGVESHDLQVEFLDSNTLVIKGHFKRHSGQTSEEVQAQFAGSSKSHYQPTVEDAIEADDDATSDSLGNSLKKQLVTPKKPELACKYLVSERLTGEFHRVFTFPARVHQDAVKANLRNGILSLLLPKEPAPKMKKIRIE